MRQASPLAFALLALLSLPACSDSGAPSPASGPVSAEPSPPVNPGDETIIHASPPADPDDEGGTAAPTGEPGGGPGGGGPGGQPVPEPGTILLVGAGLAGVALYRRRRRPLAEV